MSSSHIISDLIQVKVIPKDTDFYLMVIILVIDIP